MTSADVLMDFPKVARRHRKGRLAVETALVFEALHENRWWPAGAGVSGDQPGLMSAARITFAHFSVSDARKWPNSAGVIGIGTPPRSRMRALILGSASAAVTPLLSLSTTSRGVAAGAPRPANALVSKPTRTSLIVGMPGSSSSGADVETASARRRPALICSIDDGR